LRRGDDSGTDASGNVSGLRFVSITIPGPEEAPEAVLETSGHDVHVEVGHALTDGVVHGDEGPVSIHGLPDCGLHPLHGVEERMKGIDGEIGQTPVVGPRHHEDMTREQWPTVEEGDDICFVEHHVRGPASRGDVAEGAICDLAVIDHGTGSLRSTP